MVQGAGAAVELRLVPSGRDRWRSACRTVGRTAASARPPDRTRGRSADPSGEAAGEGWSRSRPLSPLREQRVVAEARLPARRGVQGVRGWRSRKVARPAASRRPGARTAGRTASTGRAASYTPGTTISRASGVVQGAAHQRPARDAFQPRSWRWTATERPHLRAGSHGCHRGREACRSAGRMGQDGRPLHRRKGRTRRQRAYDIRQSGARIRVDAHGRAGHGPILRPGPPRSGAGGAGHRCPAPSCRFNPLENPEVRNGVVSPPAGRAHIDRTARTPGLIRDGDVVVRAFAAIGWRWGGYWHSLKDYQHFSATGR